MFYSRKTLLCCRPSRSRLVPANGSLDTTRAERDPISETLRRIPTTTSFVIRICHRRSVAVLVQLEFRRWIHIITAECNSHLLDQGRVHCNSDGHGCFARFSVSRK